MAIAAQTLSCVKDTTDSLLPTSFSLHSVDLLPLDFGPGYDNNYLCIAFTNITNGFLYEDPANDNDCQQVGNNVQSECRVLHGNEEIQSLIRVILQSESIVEAQEDTPGIWAWPMPAPLHDTKTTIKVLTLLWFMCLS